MATWAGSNGSKKLGQPVPLSNFAADLNSHRLRQCGHVIIHRLRSESTRIMVLSVVQRFSQPSETNCVSKSGRNCVHSPPTTAHEEGHLGLDRSHFTPLFHELVVGPRVSDGVAVEQLSDEGHGFLQSVHPHSCRIEHQPGPLILRSSMTRSQAELQTTIAQQVQGGRRTRQQRRISRC